VKSDEEIQNMPVWLMEEGVLAQHNYTVCDDGW
jgi:hypothetical protein